MTFDFNPWLITTEIQIMGHRIIPGTVRSKPSSCTRHIWHSLFDKESYFELEGTEDQFDWYWHNYIVLDNMDKSESWADYDFFNRLLEQMNDNGQLRMRECISELDKYLLFERFTLHKVRYNILEEYYNRYFEAEIFSETLHKTNDYFFENYQKYGSEER